MPSFDLTTIIANIPALLIGFAFHEFAHAWVANRLGDPTPRSQGRLSLNPFVHLDLFGTIMALLFRFGWAKPVMTNPQYFRGDKQKGLMLVSVAGPITNLTIAFVAMFFWFLSLNWIQTSAYGSIILLMFQSLVFMNLGLGIFNLLPIPPLDGFTVLGGLLPRRFAPKLQLMEQYGMIILILVLFTGVLGKVLSPAVMGIFYVYEKIIVLLLTPFIG